MTSSPAPEPDSGSRSPSPDAEQGTGRPGAEQGSGRPRHAGPPVHRGGPIAPHEAPGTTAATEVAQWWPGSPDASGAASPGAASRGAADRRARRGLPGWVTALAAVALLALVGVLGFIRPGFFVTKVFDQAAVQNGVRAVLVHSYRITGVSEVVCPGTQRVLPGRDFYCVARVNNTPSRVRVLPTDTMGHYQVSRPD
jgi:hypothetical protein